jgi:type I restriction enzyme, R subunit
LNPDLAPEAWNDAIEKLTKTDYSRSLIQHNKQFYQFIRNGVPVEWRDQNGHKRHAQARVVDFRNSQSSGVPNNRFVAVRELKIQGLRVPHYNRRADLICYINGLPIVFIELKAVYRNIRAGFDENLSDYIHEHSISHAFYHNAFLVVSNGDKAKYGSITSKWDHFAEWKRNHEKDKGRLDAQMLLDGMLSKTGLLDILENFILFDDSRPGGTRKIIGRNHQVLGVNNAVESIKHQEELKTQYGGEKRLLYYEMPVEEIAYAAEKPEIASKYLGTEDTKDPAEQAARINSYPL